ncbi:MAG: DUF2520 domain-containing protein [Oligoflexia bacterium]|nr:DUF2520 domain-containing protein [Oligoflexia bacterium]
MGQVPEITYGIIGDGRMARHMIHYLTLRAIPYKQWSRKTSKLSPLETLSTCSIILVLIKDSAIDSFIQSWPEFKNKTLIHFSGALVTKSAQGLHPLMTFGSELYDLTTYEQIPFISEKEGHSFKKIFPQLKNPFYAIDVQLKPLYHALCVMSGNFTVLLWQSLFETLEKKMMIPRSAALPYLQQTAKNLVTQSQKALTGPISRKDYSTILKNIAALDDNPLQEIYLSFVKVYLPDLAHRPDEVKI